MSFSDHKITSFTHKIADLPDQPNLPADELKARFDACPEELRQAVNAICDDAQTLDAKVDSIIGQTFDGVIEKSMFSESLTAELDAKATQTALTEQLAAEAAAREAEYDALDSRIDSVSSTATQKCQLYIGTYTGDGIYPRTIYTGYTPKAVIVAPQACMSYGEYNTCGALITQDGSDSKFSRIVSGGFELKYIGNPNYKGLAYYYLALR